MSKIALLMALLKNPSKSSMVSDTRSCGLSVKCPPWVHLFGQLAPDSGGVLEACGTFQRT